MALQHSPRTTSDRLMFCLDPANFKCYGGSGNTATNIGISAESGSLFNGVTYSTDGLGAFVFDGSDDYIEFGPRAAAPPTDNSLEMVFKHTHNFVGVKYFIFSSGYPLQVYFRGDWAGDYFWYLRRVNGSSYYGDSSWGNQTGIYLQIPANQTVHLVFTHDNSTQQLKCYKNGVLVRTVDGNLDLATGLTSPGNGGLNAPGATFWIGGNQSSGAIPMTMYHLKMYTKVLSQSEVTDNFNAVRGRYGL